MYAVAVVNGYAVILPYDEFPATEKESLPYLKKKFGMSDFGSKKDGIKHLTSNRKEAEAKVIELNARKVEVSQ